MAKKTNSGSQLLSHIAETGARLEAKPNKRAAKQQHTLGNQQRLSGVHGSARRGRNVSNLWFAKMLAFAAAYTPAQAVRSPPAVDTTPRKPKRTWCCAACGREMQMCRARHPGKQAQFQR